jgi:hypothetical protein
VQKILRVPNMHDKKHQSGRKHRQDHKAAINIVGILKSQRRSFYRIDFGELKEKVLLIA